MTATGLWQDIGAGENVLTRVLRLLFLLVAAVVFYFLAVLPLTWPQQAVLGLLTLLMSLALARSSDSYLITLTLMMMSMFCTFRYGYWRISQVVRFFQDPANHWGALDAFFIFCLLLAEIYAFVILFLGYFQTIWPLRRAPVALPDNTRRMAAYRRPDSHLQRAAGCGALHRAGRAQHGLARRQAARLHSRRRRGARSLSVSPLRPASATKSALTTSMPRRATSTPRSRP